MSMSISLAHDIHIRRIEKEECRCTRACDWINTGQKALDTTHKAARRLQGHLHPPAPTPGSARGLRSCSGFQTKILCKALAMGKVDQLFVRLVRGTAGKKKTHLATLKALGLKKAGQTKILDNTPSFRGALEKVNHLVEISTLEQEQQRLADLKQKLKPREPIIVKHT